MSTTLHQVLPDAAAEVGGSSHHPLGTSMGGLIAAV